MIERLKVPDNFAKVVYICPSLVQLAPGSSHLFQSEKRIIVV